MAKNKTVKWKFLKLNGTLHRNMKVSDQGIIIDAKTGEEISQHNMAKKSVINGTDYRGITINGYTYRVHRIVCETFHGKQPKNKPYVRHIDGRKDNNKTINLEWATPSETLLAAHKKNTYSRFSVTTIRRVKRLINKGKTNEHIAEIVSMSDSNVSAIKYGYIHTHVEPHTKQQVELGNT